MVNYKKLQQIKKSYAHKDRFFLNRLCEKMNDTKPYSGLRIIHNIPLTKESIIKTEPLLLSGAEVTLSAANAVKPTGEVLKIIYESNINLNLKKEFDGSYDIVLDCCCEIPRILNTKIGNVELTQTGSNLYKQLDLNYPVISIDDSILKNIETYFGTSYAFIVALQNLVKESLIDKKFIVFGYGKVGKGIVKALLKHTSNIIIIDQYYGQIKINTNKEKVLEILSINDQAAITEHIKDSFAIITCTGKKNLISETFEKKYFSGKYLVNMGAHDEFGYKFHYHEVLHNKQPINFAVSNIKFMKYLDPVFYAHNIAVDLLLNKQFPAGYHPFPNDLANKIVLEWSALHKLDISSFYEYSQVIR